MLKILIQFLPSVHSALNFKIFSYLRYALDVFFWLLLLAFSSCWHSLRCVWLRCVMSLFGCIKFQILHMQIAYFRLQLAPSVSFSFLFPAGALAGCEVLINMQIPIESSSSTHTHITCSRIQFVLRCYAVQKAEMKRLLLSGRHKARTTNSVRPFAVASTACSH